MQMKTKHFFSSLIFGFAAFLLFVPGQALAAAFGISPPWIENEHIKPGTNFVYIINLSANGLPEDMEVDVQLSGDAEVLKWLHVQNKEGIVMPKGQSIVPVRISVNIPANASLGQYTGNIKFALTTKNKNNEMSIVNLLGGNMVVNLKVVDHDVIDYWVRDVQVDDITEGQPIDFKLSLKNLGNTTLKNIEIKASVIDKQSGEIIASGAADQLSGPIQPQTMGDVKLSMPMQEFSAGRYWVDVDVLKEGKSVYKNRIHLVVESKPETNTSISTGVEVAPEDQILKPAAPVLSEPAQSTDIQTSVTVRAPFTNQLILVMIGILIVLTIIIGKMYLVLKKKR